MANVTFEHNGTSVDCADGSLLKDIAQSENGGIDFGCQEGECATCIVEILSGMENLSAPTENETITLTDEERAANFRLTCQLTIKSGEVVLRPTEELF